MPIFKHLTSSHHSKLRSCDGNTALACGPRCISHHPPNLKSKLMTQQFQLNKQLQQISRVFHVWGLYLQLPFLPNRILPNLSTPPPHMDYFVGMSPMALLISTCAPPQRHPLLKSSKVNVGATPLCFPGALGTPVVQHSAQHIDISHTQLISDLTQILQGRTTSYSPLSSSSKSSALLIASTW